MHRLSPLFPVQPVKLVWAKRLPRWLGLFLVFLALWSGVATAQTPVPESDDEVVSFSLYPANGQEGMRVDVSGQPGATIDVDLVLSNSGTVPLNLVTYTSNVISAINGGFDMEPVGGTMREPTMWMTYPTETVSLDPGEMVRRTLMISIPEDAGPGQYVNGIAVQTTESLPIEGSESFRQVLRKLMPVVITVPGEIEPSFSLGESAFTWQEAGLVLQVPVENTGNIRVQPAGELILSDPAGTVLFTAPIAMGSVYAGNSTHLAVLLPSPPPQGDYLVTLDLTDPDTGANASLADRGITLTVPPDEAASAGHEELLAVESAKFAPNADPIQFANVDIVIANNGEEVKSARLILQVSRDGDHVEDFVIAENVPLELGDTTFSTRYIPVNGFEPGTWDFSLRVDVVDDSGGTRLLLEASDVGQITAPQDSQESAAR